MRSLIPHVCVGICAHPFIPPVRSYNAIGTWSPCKLLHRPYFSSTLGRELLLYKICRSRCSRPPLCDARNASALRRLTSFVFACSALHGTPTEVLVGPEVVSLRRISITLQLMICRLHWRDLPSGFLFSSCTRTMKSSFAVSHKQDVIFLLQPLNRLLRGNLYIGE
jgi:hypothetical protein